MEGFELIEDREHNLLVKKCQENGWLRKNGFAWQDDPYLEEYPYRFYKTQDIESLRNVFVHGNRAIREGFIYKDLAFIQQVDGGDEWWTCKRFDNEWVAFESWSFSQFARDPIEFKDAILHMQYATKKECTSLDYMDSKIPHIEESLSIKKLGAVEASKLFASNEFHPLLDQSR